MLFSLKGKTAIVTGGAGYLGSAISEGFVRAGARVVIAGVSEEKNREMAEHLSRQYQADCHSVYIDIGKVDSVEKKIREIYSWTNSIDIFVNNAYFGTSGDIEEMPEEDWKAGIDGSINGVYRCTKAVLPYMLAQNNGCIINVASMYGVVSPDPAIYTGSKWKNPANYGAGKAAIIQFTRYVACHYGAKGIRANAVSPGPFPNRRVQEDTDFIHRLEQKVPLRRIGKPEDLAGVMVFLASPAAAYVTGQNIGVDGGWTAW
ncbi:SDR family NAD(P)-dependent oxidoreductase [Desmospora activa]|uniref:Gluconate 5-dehydrogenase n=1 Tax=Desmospora activa DSM 45169 TaxID=1121389 RepID=A0A2T4ZAE2_9BACL|nr:SDR family oxidoreductase [Desmospora activa]PTM58859.1 gluconate 5-dehydrogenase [Desmospora activa DSM 45169]